MLGAYRMAGPVLSSWCTLSPTILTTTTRKSKYYHLQMRERGEAWACGGQSECLAGQLRTNASPHPTGRQHSWYNSSCVHSSLPQLRYTNPEDRLKSSMATRKFPFVFKRSETLCSKQCARRQSPSCLQRTSWACSPAPSRVSTNMVSPETKATSSSVLVDVEVEVGSFVFTMVNLVLSREETQAIFVKQLNE